MIVDAKGLVAGRLASKVAKAVIRGESVTIVNAEEAIIVGNKESTLAKFKMRVDAAVKSNPHYGPKYSRIPDRMLRRMIRNMFPTKKRAKKRMIERLTIFNSIPKELEQEKMEKYEDIKCNERYSFMTLKELALLLGGRW
ncbi:MAG: 50S ribosomal protein L13 [archaeon]